MIAYLDTHIAVDLLVARKPKTSTKVDSLIRSCELLISPMVLIEFEYLHEIGRIRSTSRDLQLKMEQETPIKVCSLPFATVARVALDEKWTRDAFDRIIVAQAKAGGLAFLISSDERIAKHYPRTVW